jgi:thiamine biosynthesis lipoprotein
MVLQETKRLEKKYNYFDSDSYLSQLNQRKTDHLDQETKSLLQRANKYYKLTNHIFDITVATIKDLYKNSHSTSDLEREKEKLSPFLGCEHFKIKKDRLIFDNPHTKIDLGGFVKEYAVDRAAMLLKKKKCHSALINFGGDIYALGSKPEGEPFIVAIKDPNDRSKNIQEVAITNQALTTSASYERSHTIEGQSYSHIIPTTSIHEQPLSVTIVASNCVESGVYSTSLMIDPHLKQTNKSFIF